MPASGGGAACAGPNVSNAPTPNTAAARLARYISSSIDTAFKYRLERWLLSRRTVLGSLNWIRQRLHKPDFVAPMHPGGSS